MHGLGCPRHALRQLLLLKGQPCALLHLPQVNHLSEGVKLGLRDDREKRSEALGRWAVLQLAGCSLPAPAVLGVAPRRRVPPTALPAGPPTIVMPDFRSPKPRFPRRNVMFHGDSRISSLPPYLTIQVGAGGCWLV